MAKAIWNGKSMAESGDTIVIESNHYFPPESLDEFNGKFTRNQYELRGTSARPPEVMRGICTEIFSSPTCSGNLLASDWPNFRRNRLELSTVVFSRARCR